MSDVFNQALCDEKHEHIQKTLDRIESFCVELKDGQQIMHNRLFIENGNESLQSKINRHDRWIKGVCVSIFALGVPMIIWIIQWLIKN